MGHRLSRWGRECVTSHDDALYKFIFTYLLLLIYPYTSVPTRVTMPNLVVLVQTAETYTDRSAGKNDPSRLAFQGHSRSSETTWIDRPTVTSY